MADIEKVIKGLECCNKPNNHDDCPYNGECHYNVCTHKLLDDALELLKEQQPKESRWVSIPYKKDRICKRCGHDEPYKYAEKETEIYMYCPHCGAKMEERTE